MKYFSYIRGLFVLGVLIGCLTANASAQERETIVPRDHLNNGAIQKNARDSGSKNTTSILLRLGQRHFDPLLSVPEVSPGLNRIDTFVLEDIGYYIVQFDGPIESSWKAAIAAMGVNCSIICRISPLSCGCLRTGNSLFVHTPMFAGWEFINLFTESAKARWIKRRLRKLMPVRMRSHGQSSWSRFSREKT